MRSVLRSLSFGLAAALAGAAMAQQPYTILVNGVISGCYPGQMVNIETNSNTQPYLNFDVPVNPNTCTWSATLGVASNPASFTASTPCNGMIVSATGNAQFNFLTDSVSITISLDCGGGEVYDCNDVLNGPDMPGTPCEDGNPLTVGDVWTPACVCMGQDTSGVYDCNDVLNGPDMPGTACVDFFGNAGIWSVDCICQTNTGDDDCLGNPGGGALPGTPCTVPGTILEGTWSIDCVCEPNTTNPCEADFWVLQAFGPDSLPVPYELWVWNLSSGGSGNFQFLWNFGDGSSSTEAYPTHVYSGNGPYVLCLTITDNIGCTDTHCDTISINEDGIYEGMPVHDIEDRQEGFTLNVQNPSADAVVEMGADNSIATWPNPVTDELNVAVAGDMKGLVTITITDLDGRTVRSERMSLSGGRSQLRIATGDLSPGMYLLRLSNGPVNLSQRFVKTH